MRNVAVGFSTRERTGVVMQVVPGKLQDWQILLSREEAEYAYHQLGELLKQPVLPHMKMPHEYHGKVVLVDEEYEERIGEASKSASQSTA